jgi:hypothetical protein
MITGDPDAPPLRVTVEGERAALAAMTDEEIRQALADLRSGPNGKAVPRFRRVTWKQVRVKAEADRLLREYCRLPNPTEAQRAELARAQMAAFRRRR